MCDVVVWSAAIAITSIRAGQAVQQLPRVVHPWKV
jgi:hypothetical protein